MGGSGQGVAEKGREGMRVEAPTSADRQAALSGQPNDPGSPGLPAGYKGRGVVTLAPREVEGDREGLEELML